MVGRLASAVAKASDVVVRRAAGCWVESTTGRRLLDFAAGIGALSTGHCHPAVVEAVRQQAGAVLMAQQNCFASSEAQLGLLDALTKVVPSHLGEFLFVSSGSEAVDNAIKVARAATGRPNIIAFSNSFHGRTYGAMAVTHSKNIYRQFFSPMMPGVVVAPFPNCLHCRSCPPPSFLADGPRTCCGSPLEALQWTLQTHSHPEETAAVLVEPIQGEGGFVVPPPGFLAGLRQICDRHGMLLIIDEVQAGVGRTGAWWGHQVTAPGVHADMMLIAKGLGSGLPIAALAARPDLFAALSPGMLGGTYGGSAIASAAATATIGVIQSEGLLGNATARGQQLTAGLLQLAEEFPIMDVRGRGLMIAIELGGSNGAAAPRGAAARLTAAALNEDLLLLTAGAREVVRFLPPLTVSASEVEECLERLRRALVTVYSSTAQLATAASK